MVLWWVSFFNLWSYTYNYRASALPLAQKNRACATRPSPLVGGVWAGDYMLSSLPCYPAICLSAIPIPGGLCTIISPLLSHINYHPITHTPHHHWQLSLHYEPVICVRPLAQQYCYTSTITPSLTLHIITGNCHFTEDPLPDIVHTRVVPPTIHHHTHHTTTNGGLVYCSQSH